MYFSQEKKFSRKVAEVFVAQELEDLCGKKTLFELYVNSIYFGAGYYNIYDAAHGYYDKDPSDLNDYECTMLAGVPNAPSVYAPTVNPKLAEERRQQVLTCMVENGYITEGDFDGSGSIKIFPVAKSTELMFFNDTDWQRFAKETFVRYGALSTMEGVTAVAEQYYNWSGGRALFGRDAMANYMIVGAKQLGCEIFEVNNGKMTLHFDHDVVRKLWDNYYVPFVKGYFAANGRFRSDDVKTGALLGCVGSCASATFFPKQVMPGDNQVHDIEMKVLPAPRFAGSEKVAVQQGAGMVVTTGTEAEINGAVTFLKWFTEPQNNIAFSVESGYLPVTIAANDMDAIRASGLELTDTMEQVLSGAVDTVRKNELYTPTAFAGGNAVRKILEYSMGDQVSADRDTVLERIAAGQSAEAAMAEFLTDDYFEAWYQATLAQLQQYEG